MDSDKHSEDEESSNPSSDESEDMEEMISAEMAGFTPEVQHRPGIITLLNQMFRDNSINSSTLADYIIEKKLGTVVILDDDEDGDDGDGAEGVFSITAPINFLLHQKAEIVENLKTFLLKKIEENGTKTDIETGKTYVSGSDTHCTFLVNEKIVNLPPDFTVTLLQNLEQESSGAAKADSKGKKELIVTILKLYKKEDEETLRYVHPEEKIICDFATTKIDYPVDVEQFGSICIDGEEEEDEEEDCPQFRRICFIPGETFYTTCLTALKKEVEKNKAGKE